jgi:hypothetical protein
MGANGHHVVRHSRLQFKRCRPRVGDVDDDEVGQVRQQPHRLGEVLGLGFVEVEDHRYEAKVAEFLSQPLQDHHPAFSEAAQQKHAFLSDGVDDVANLLVAEKQINELRDLNVVDRDRGLVETCDDQALLLGPPQF